MKYIVICIAKSFSEVINLTWLVGNDAIPSTNSIQNYDRKALDTTYIYKSVFTYTPDMLNQRITCNGIGGNSQIFVTRSVTFIDGKS